MSDPDDEIPRDTAPEIGDAGAASGAIQRTVAAAAGVAGRVTYWPAQLCVLGAILLQVRLPGKLTVGPTWLLPSLEGALLIALAATTPFSRSNRWAPSQATTRSSAESSAGARPKLPGVWRPAIK